MKRFTTVFFDRAGDKVIQQWIATDEERADVLRTSLLNLGLEFATGSLLPMPLYSLALSGDDNYDANFMTKGEVRAILEDYAKAPLLAKLDEQLDALAADPSREAVVRIEDGDLVADITCTHR